MRHLFISLCLCLTVSSCGKKQATPTPTRGANTAVQTADQAQAADASGDAVPNQQTPAPGVAPGSQPVAASSQPDAAPAPPVQVVAGDYNAVLSSLTQGLRRYGVEKQRVPASLNEVIAGGYITVMPQPPPGKKFALDAKSMQVILVNQ